MKKILTYIIPFVLLCLFVDNATSEDMPEKLSQLSPDWNKTNTLDKEIFVQQQKNASKIVGRRWDRMEDEGLTEIFWGITKKASKVETFIGRGRLTTISIPGYVVECRDHPPHPLDFFFRVDVSCFKDISLSSILNKNDPEGSYVRVHMQSFDNHVEAKKLALTCIPMASSSPMNFLSLYKIDKGPGDFCLVDVTGPAPKFFRPHTGVDLNAMHALSDSRVVFVRGNVAVYLTSSYENFGCMDLACRIDAWLVEQMKRQGVTEKEKEVKQ